MANKPFDYRITNPLERPTSSDQNIAQGQEHADARLVMRRMFYDGGGTGTGSMEGFFPRDFPVYPTSPASLSVDMYPGLGFQNGAAETDIGGIAGLNDSYTYKPVVSSTIINIPVATPPATAGQYRYDLIQVRALQNTERLTDSTTTDIYSPSLNSFGGASKYKTLTADLVGQSIQVVPHTSTPTGPIVYMTGPESSTPVFPTASTDYLPVAYVLVSYGATTIVSGDIVDARPLLKLPDALVPSSLSDFGDGGSIVYSTGTDLAVSAQGSTGQPLVSGGSGAPTWASAIGATFGGTGQTGYTTGDMLYANGGTSLAKLAAGSSSQILRGGATPSWGTVPTAAFASNSVPVGALQSSFTALEVLGTVVVTGSVYTTLASVIGNFERGNIQFAVMPRDGGAIMQDYVTTAISGTQASFIIRYTVTGPSGFSKSYRKQVYFPISSVSAAIMGELVFTPISTYVTVNGSYTITVDATPTSSTSDTLTVANYQFRAWQG